MNAILICVFHKEELLNLLYLLLESILRYGNHEDILIYTSTHFMKKIQEQTNAQIIFEINDEYNSVETACSARLDFFDFRNTQYEKVLYLDTDILVIKDIQPIFKIAQADILYALEEGTVHAELHGWDYWGRTLFQEDGTLEKYHKKTAFNSGVLLFRNCETIRLLFLQIKHTIRKRHRTPLCYDQPHIVYNSVKYGLYDNQLMKMYVAINDENVFTNKTILHFAGGVGSYERKFQKMSHFMNIYGWLNPLQQIYFRFLRVLLEAGFSVYSR